MLLKVIIISTQYLSDKFAVDQKSMGIYTKKNIIFYCYI